MLLKSIIQDLEVNTCNHRYKFNLQSINIQEGLNNFNKQEGLNNFNKQEGLDKFNKINLIKFLY